MSQSPQDVQFRPYGPDRFPGFTPFAERGYLFTLPGSFPEDTPAHTNVTDWEMAVYRTDDGWEVRDVDGHRKQWGTGALRREAVAAAYAEVYRVRHRRAAEIAEKRTQVLGLEAVPPPPFTVEATAGITLVCHPDAIGILRHIQPADGDLPAAYQVDDIDGGEPYVILHDGRITLRETTVGVLHARCGCDPCGATFENEPDALAYANEALTFWWKCPKSRPADEDQAGLP